MGLHTLVWMHNSQHRMSLVEMNFYLCVPFIISSVSCIWYRECPYNVHTRMHCLLELIKHVLQVTVVILWSYSSWHPSEIQPQFLSKIIMKRTYSHVSLWSKCLVFSKIDSGKNVFLLNPVYSAVAKCHTYLHDNWKYAMK